MDMESPKESSSPERASSPTKEEDIMEFFPVMQHAEDSDSPKEPFPSLSTEETAATEEASVFDSKYDIDLGKEAGSTSPVTRDEDVPGNSSPVMENSPVIESSNPTWKDNDSDRGSLPPSPGLDVEGATEEAPATYGNYSKDDSEDLYQDEPSHEVSRGEEGSTGRRYSMPEYSDRSLPESPREEEPATGNTYSVPAFSDDGSHSHNESFSPIAAREDEPSAGKAYSVPDFSDDGSHSGIASFSPTAGREEEGASARKPSARLMTLSDEEIDLEVPQRSFSPEPEPRTFSDEERDYKEELPSPASKKKAARVGAYPNYSDDSDSERGSYRPWEDSNTKESPVAEKAPVVEEASPVIDTPSPRIDYSFDVESDVERIPPPAPRLRPIGTAKGDSALEKEISVPEKASPVTQKPAAKIPEKTAAKKKEWAVAKKASAKANAVVNSITKKLDHIRGNANRVRENIRKEIRILQSYQPTLDTAQSHRAAESAAMTSALFLITLYIVLLSIIYRLIATSYLPFLSRFVF